MLFLVRLDRAVLWACSFANPVFTPRSDGSGCDFSGPTRYDKLFTRTEIGPPDRPSFIGAEAT